MGRLPKGYTKKKDGRLQYAFTIDGKRYYVAGATVKECQKKAIEKRDMIAKGLKTKSGKVTLDQYYLEWQKRRENHIKPATRYTDDRRYKRIAAALGRKKLIDIDRRDVFKLQSELAVSLSSKGVNDTISLLRSILESATIDRIIPYNPTAGVKALKKTEDEKDRLKNQHRYLSASEIENFFTFGQDSIYFNLFRFMLMTGVRLGEAAALTWNDIDEPAEVIHITKTVTRENDKTYAIGSPKTQDSKRDIPLTDELRAVLADQRRQQEFFFGFRDVIGERRIFTASDTGLIKATNVSPVIGYICKKATAAGNPITRFGAHSLRHTFISRQLADNVPLNVIAAQVGHSNTITLQKYYSHEDPAKLREVFRKVSRDMAEMIKIS